MEKLLAYHSDQTVKTDILAQLQMHHDADAIVKGQYWQDGKGCAVGCTIHSGRHVEYEMRFGIPQMLARLEDQIFEGLPNGKAKEWPIRFMKAIKPGTDLSRVGWQFLHWLLTDEKVNPGINHPLVRDAIKQCADVLIPLTKGEPANESAARSAARSAERSAAWSAAWSAERSAARSAGSAARSAGSAASSAGSAASSAESAARSAGSAARSAGSAASAARSAERSAAWSAESAESAASSAAWSAANVCMADKLIELIEAAPLA